MRHNPVIGTDDIGRVALVPTPREAAILAKMPDVIDYLYHIGEVEEATRLDILFEDWLGSVYTAAQELESESEEEPGGDTLGSYDYIVGAINTWLIGARGFVGTPPWERWGHWRGITAQTRVDGQTLPQFIGSVGVNASYKDLKSLWKYFYRVRRRLRRSTGGRQYGR